MNIDEFGLLGLVPILESFPTFESAIKFGEAIRPLIRKSVQYQHLKKFFTYYRRYTCPFYKKDIEIWLLDDSLTKITRCKDGGMYTEKYQKFYDKKKPTYKLHCLDSTITLPSGSVKRTDSPAETYHHVLPSGEMELEEMFWYKQGKLHRENLAITLPSGSVKRTGGPAVTYFGQSLQVQTWMRNGKRHRDGGPAEIRYHSNGVVSSETWFEFDMVHREFFPAITTYKANGLKTMEEWFRNGDMFHKKIYRPNGTIETWYNRDVRLSRKDAPAYVEKLSTNYQEQWRKNGKYHRLDGPAYVSIKNGLRKEIWYKNGLLWNENGPTRVTTKNGITIEEWVTGVINVIHHREDLVLPDGKHVMQPAWIKSKNGKILDVMYYLNGVIQCEP